MIIPTGYAQLNFIGSGTAYARGWQVAIGVENATDLSPGTLAGIGFSAWNANIDTVQSNQCSLTSVLAKRGPNATGTAFELSSVTDGTVSSQAESQQAAVLVTKLTAHGGRQGRGRMFMPGVCESQTDGAGLLNGAALAAWSAAMEGFLNDLEAADAPMVLLHADAITAPYLVTNVVVNALFASQRRRIRRVGGRRTV